MNRQDVSVDTGKSGAAEVMIVAVVVTFNPEIEHLRNLCSRLDGQVSHIVIVDNSDGASKLDSFNSRCVRVLSLGNNHGIGAAQNCGVREAMSMGASHVLFLDQDSLPSADMVSLLYRTEKQILSNAPDTDIAAVGPCALKGEEGLREAFVPVEASVPVMQRSQREKETGETVRALYLHSSGTLVRIDVLRRVGEMDESLFIDMVDMEWCFRAFALGFVCFGAYRAELRHHVGDRQHIGLAGFRREVSVHPPIRTYYQTRNWLIMARKNHVPRFWLLRHGMRNILLRFLMLVVFVEDRRERVRYFYRGLLHGLQGRGGALVQVR